MQILIANPPWYPQAAWGLRAGCDAPRAVPVGWPEVPWPADLAQAAAVLVAEEHAVRVADSIATRESLESYHSRIRELVFDVVAVATSAASLADDLDLIAATAAVRPVVILWPGLPEGAEALLGIDGVRAVVCGESERGLLAAAQIEEPGVYPADPVPSLDDLPWPVRDYSVHRYRLPLAGLPDGPQLPLRCSRGPERWRSSESLLHEIEYVRGNFPRLTHLCLTDDAVNANRVRWATLATALDDAGWPWAARVRLETEADVASLSSARGATALEVRLPALPSDEGCDALRELTAACVALTLAPDPALDPAAVAEVARAVGAVAVFPRPGPQPPVSVRDALLAAQAAAAPVTGVSRRRVFIVGMHLPVYMPPWLVNGAREAGHEAIAVDPFADPRAVLTLLDTEPDDVVIADRGLGLPPDIIERIPAQTVLYSPEVLPTLAGTHPHAEQRYAEFVGVAPHFDHVILHDSHGLAFLEAEGHTNLRGVVTMPYEPRRHRDLGLPRTIDVLFVGSGSDHRTAWIDGLRAAGIDVQWPQVWDMEFIRALNRAKIVLNLHYTHLPNTEQRVVEALACGCFVVSEPLTDPERFRDGEHLVFVTRETAPDVIRHYLAHPEERERIARAGQAWVRQRHTARHAVEQMLALLPAPARAAAEVSVS